MTFNTGNPVPSWDPRDLIDNADVVDEYVNSAAETVTTRTGVEKRTLASIENEAVQVITDFENAGGVLTTAAEAAKNQAQVFRNESEFFAGQAEQARDDAVAVVYSGDATLEPAPGSIPVARADGTIDPGWLPDQLMMRPNRIDEDVIIPDGYNAFFIDPVEFGPNVTVTGLGNSTLRGV